MSYSVFIPRVFTNISEQRIVDIFVNYSIGQVDHVDLVRKSNYGNYCMAFVHFKYLYDTSSAQSFKRDVENPDKVAKFVYDHHWYWIVCPYERNSLDQCNQHHDQRLIQQPSQDSKFNHHNHHTNDFVNNSPQGMWMMTNNGLQWCWSPHTTPNDYNNDIHNSNHTMIPQQVTYGNLNTNNHSRPKRRLRFVPSPNDIIDSTTNRSDNNDNDNNEESDDDYQSIPEDEKEIEPLSARYEEGDRLYGFR